MMQPLGPKEMGAEGKGSGRVTEVSGKGGHSYKWLALSLEKKAPPPNYAKQTSSLSPTWKLPHVNVELQ